MPSRSSVLVVDPVPDDAQALVHLLRRAGHVCQAVSPGRAWALCAQGGADLIVIAVAGAALVASDGGAAAAAGTAGAITTISAAPVDPAAPAATAAPLEAAGPVDAGIALARRLRAEPPPPGVPMPIVLVGAGPDPALEALGLGLGAVDVWSKPLHAEITRLRVAGHLERARLARALGHSLRAGGLALWRADAEACVLGEGAADLLGWAPGTRLPWRTLVHPADLPLLHKALGRMGPGFGTATVAGRAHRRPARQDTDRAPDREHARDGDRQSVPRTDLLVDTTEHGADPADPADRLVGGPADPVDLRLHQAGGGWVWAALQGRRVAMAALGAAHGAVTQYRGSFVNIGSRKRLEAALLQRESEAAALMGSLHDLVLAFDAEGQVRCCHLPAEFELAWPDGPCLGRRLEDLLPAGILLPLQEALEGLRLDGRRRSFECRWPAVSLLGQGGVCHGLASLSLLSPAARDATGAGPALAQAAGLALADGGTSARVSSDACEAGLAERLVNDQRGAFGDDGDAADRSDVALLVLRDVTEHKVEEEAIRQLAYFDPLTALPNRRLLQDRLGQAQAGSHRRQRHGALIFIDVDHFKAVNDTHGHRVGDQLLVELARRLQVSVRACDTVARLGGDEFVIVLADLDAQAEVARGQLGQIADKMLARLARRYDIEAHRLHCTCSLGAVLFHGTAASMDELLAQADAAMYRAKAAGRNAGCVAGVEGVQRA